MKTRRQSNEELDSRLVSLETETPKFATRDASHAVTANVTSIKFSVIEKDNRSGYNAVTGQYTIQEAGDYNFNWQAYISNTVTMYLYKNGVKYAQGSSIGSSLAASGGSAFIVDCQIGDVFEIRGDATGTVSNGDPRLNRFSGWKVK